MKASSVWDLLGPFLLITIIAHGEALTPSETCQLVKNATFIGDPADCQGYYYCRNGVPVGGKCGTGLLFDSKRGACDYAKNVACQTNVTTMCAGLNAVYKSDPSNCAGYCHCSNGVTSCTTCPTGQIYDPSTISCKYPSDSFTCVSGSPCLLVPDGFMKNPESCTGWFYCANGQIGNRGDCTNGMYYDALNGMCNYASEVGCNVVTTAAPTTAPKPPTGLACSTKGTYFADNSTCRGYFACVEIDQKLTLYWGQCPVGSQFNPDKGTCTNPYNVDPVCKFDRCEGMSLNFMAVPDTQCKKYVTCSDGKTTSKPLDCKEPYIYFNEKAQACSDAWPDLKICGEDPTSQG